MSDSAFDTLGAARKLKASGLGAEQADAIVETMSQSASQFVTVEHFDAGIAALHSRIDALQTELRTRTDTIQTELRTRTDAIRSEMRTRTDAIRSEMRSRTEAIQSEMKSRTEAIQSGFSARTDAIQTRLNTRIDEMHAKFDAVRAEIWRSILIAVGVLIAANALMMTILGIFLNIGAPPS